MHRPWSDAQEREDGEIGRDREQRGRDREQGQAEEDAEPAVDMRAEKADHESGDRHAHGAGIDGKAHRGGRHAVVLRQRRQDRLRREQVDHGEKGRQADDQRAQRRAGRWPCMSIGRLSSARKCRSWRVSLRRWKRGCDARACGATRGIRDVTSATSAGQRSLVTCCGRADPCGRRRHRESRSPCRGSSTSARCRTLRA